MHYKLNFKGSEEIQKFYSQAAQDIFVLSCLDGKKNGIFVDLGCGHPIIINNTFLLEEKYNWSGVSVDINHFMINSFFCRKSKALCEDATKINFHKIVEITKENHFDYLSLDLEPASVTYECLRNIDFGLVQFSLITYEHDSYRFGNKYKMESRQIFESNGYSRICSDVSNDFNAYEDWYYNPKYISYDRIKTFESNNKEWKEILFKKK